jgi:2-polyprenyl-6-methoxyphenol hydroxylase-like FAD-dependent oxidoreductase
MKIIVVGASMAGLSAAIALSRQGHDVRVYERSTRDRERTGGGLVAQDRMVEFLEKYNIAVPGDIAVPAGDRVYIDEHNQVRAREQAKPSYTAWDTIYRRLRDQVPDERMFLGKDLARVEIDASAARCYFSNGTWTQADLVVAADGILSPTRRALVPSALPEYAGYVAWRGVVPLEGNSSRLNPLLTENFVVFAGEGTQMLSYPIPEAQGCTKRDRRRINFVWYEPVNEQDELDQVLTDRNGEHHSVAVPQGLIHPDIRDRIRVTAKYTLPEMMADLVWETEEPFVQGIFDLELSRLVYDRVILIGDAAALIRPHVGYGASKAMTDADRLGEAIGPGDRIDPDALHAWETDATARGHDLAEMGKEISRTSSLAC